MLQMAAIQSFNALEFVNSVASLALAFFLGMLIGSERQYRQRTAGLRTNVLVSLGAAAFVDLGMRLNASSGAVQVVAYVVSGVGFLGAGVIMKEGMNVRGLNTAATLWSSAAVGAFCGADLLAEATLLTGFIIVGNTFLRPLVNFINRIPIDERAGEATYEIQVTCDGERASEARELLIQRLEASNYPVGDIQEATKPDSSVQIIARLVSTAVDPREMDAVVNDLRLSDAISDASWSSSTTD
jgi:putative Mg2+ transporter-C (MgtC) family protein